MGCCGQNTTGAGAAAVDTGKRVNYTKGMLLGVDDFVQEQAWGIARRHELARELLGYGTVRGLQVLIDPGAPRVRVTPGMAWMPSGTPVCVPSEQCCDINAWLRKHWLELPAAVNQLPQPAPLTVYVVLSYDSCLTDTVPVPGEPCRSEEDLTAASRIADCFTLELRQTPPDQVEENAVRDFADWLAAVPVDASSPPLSEQAFLDQLRAAAHDWLQPSSPHPRDYMFGSPPAALGSTDALLQAALRLWATELRPLWRARYGCGPNPATPGGPDDAVLLAALDLRVHSADQSADADVRIVEDARPVLMSLRGVQELITQNPAPEPAHGVVAAASFGLPSALGSDTAYARADHSHGTPALTGDADVLPAGGIGAGEVRVRRLQGVPLAATPPSAIGQVLTFGLLSSGGNGWSASPLPFATTVTTQQRFGMSSGNGSLAVAARADHSHGTPSLVGDVEVAEVGAPPVQKTFVRGLQGVPVEARTPDLDDVLAYDGARWSPRRPDARRIEIVAAGQITISLDDRLQATGTPSPVSNPTKIEQAQVQPDQANVLQVDVIVADIADADDRASGFIVKLVPMIASPTPSVFATLPSLVAVKAESSDSLAFGVLLTASDKFAPGSYSFQFEVTRFALLKKSPT